VIYSGMLDETDGLPVMVLPMTLGPAPSSTPINLIKQFDLVLGALIMINEVVIGERML